MATIRRKRSERFSILQRDPGPWPPILLNWMATLAIIMVFGLVMLFSALLAKFERRLAQSDRR